MFFKKTAFFDKNSDLLLPDFAIQTRLSPAQYGTPVANIDVITSCGDTFPPKILFRL
jgi:hypothetical protein